MKKKEKLWLENFYMNENWKSKENWDKNNETIVCQENAKTRRKLQIGKIRNLGIMEIKYLRKCHRDLENH